jgi:hypothetical protein
MISFITWLLYIYGIKHPVTFNRRLRGSWSCDGHFEPEQMSALLDTKPQFCSFPAVQSPFTTVTQLSRISPITNKCLNWDLHRNAGCQVVRWRTAARHTAVFCINAMPANLQWYKINKTRVFSICKSINLNNVATHCMLTTIQSVCKQQSYKKPVTWMYLHHCGHPNNLLTFWRRNFFFIILAHPVYKMWIIQGPNMLELWNKLHFEEKEMESI